MALGAAKAYTAVALPADGGRASRRVWRSRLKYTTNKVRAVMRVYCAATGSAGAISCVQFDALTEPRA